MTEKSSNLYQQIVEISEDYLGPAAERFINRQIETHLAIVPEKIKEKDLKKLVQWIKLAFSLISNDTDESTEYAARLLNLIESSASYGKAR